MSLFPNAAMPDADDASPADETTGRPSSGPGSSREPRPPVVGIVQGDHARAKLPVHVYARVMEQAVARSPVPLDDVEDFNVTNLSMRALANDVRDDTDADDHPLVLDVLVDPSGLDDAIALERLRRIVNDRSNPIDAIRLLGPFDAT